MTFEKAKQEFEIRYYLWAISEFEKEINESFPNLRSFKFGPIWELHQFMQQIDKSEQLILVHSLLKRFHSDAVKALGESTSNEELLLRNRLDKFRSNFYGVAWKSPSGEKIKFVSKNKLRKIMVEKFTKAYGDRCVKIVAGEEPDPWFEMKFAGWIVSTRFEFGRSKSLIKYNQSIQSETRIQIHHPDNPEIAGSFIVMLGQVINFASWLGICSQTEWEYLIEEDVDQACDAVIKLCGHFFEVAPKLLKGLEFEKITSE
jgi:hypothetical protein